MLEAAQGVDDIQLRVRKRQKKDSDADNESEDEETDTPDESPTEFIARINLYVAIHLARAPKNTRDSYKDGQIYQTRKDLINEFLKSCIMKKCQNSDCGWCVHPIYMTIICMAALQSKRNSVAYTFRKEGHIKIIEYDLSARQKGQLTRKRPDVLLAEKGLSLSSTSHSSTRNPTNGDVDMDSGIDDEDEDDEEEELEGEDVMSDVEKKNEVALPKAANGKVKTLRGRNERVVAPEECRAHLRKLFHNEAIICALLFGRHGPFAPLSPDQLSFASADMFFLDVLPVSPTRFRPPAKMADTLFEHPQNELLAKVLQTSYRMRDININLREASQKGSGVDSAARKAIMSALLERLVQLQIDVNSFMDSSKNPQVMRQGKLPPPGVKQGLEKKEGLFRKHMMVSALWSLQKNFNSSAQRANASTMLLDQ